jgi:hypothetical protein
LRLFLSFSSSFFFKIVGFRMIGFRRFTLFDEVFFFAVIVAFFFLFWSLAPLLCFFLKVFFSFSERRISFLIYFVGVLSRFVLKVGVFVISLVFLGLFFEIVVEACGCRD